MATFPPAGMSSDEDDDDEMDFTTFSKPPVPVPSVQSTNPSSSSRGRGRGTPKIPWEEDDDSWGIPASPMKFQTPSSSTLCTVSNVSAKSPGFSSSGSPNRFGSQDSRSSIYANVQAPITKVDYLYSIPCVNKTQAEDFHKQIRSAWSTREVEEFSKVCKNVYGHSENVYSMGLFQMVRSSDFLVFQTSRTLAASVMSELKSYLKNAKPAKSMLNETLQEVAFSLVMKQKKIPLIKLVIEVYEIAKIRDKMIESIRNFSSHGQYKEACSAATALELYCFDVHDFVIPLLFQDRLALVEEYLENSSEMQVQALSYLDGLLVQRHNLTNMLLSYMSNRNMDMNEVNRDKLNEKSYTKLIKRLADKYKVDPAVIPNVKIKQKMGEIHHLFHRRFDKKLDMNEENFHELLGEMVGNNNYLIEEALYLMRANNDYDGAVKFVHKFNFPDEVIPHDIRELMHKSQQPVNVPKVLDENWEDWEADPPSNAQQVSLAGNTTQRNLDLEVQSQSPENWNRLPISSLVSSITQPIYEIPLAFECISMVSTPIDVIEFCNYIHALLKKEDTVVAGFDAEWKPVMAKLDCAALLQIAFKENIFLIDIVSLKECDAVDQKISFKNIFETFFTNEKVMKLGYDVKNDFKMLASVAPEWVDIASKIKGILDLHIIKAEIFKRNRAFFIRKSQPGTESGLTELLELCLQKNLSKADQFSDWERRPLKDTQILYAAADAYCLLQIFEFIKMRDTEVSVGLDEMIKQHDKSREAPTRKRQSPFEIVSAVIPYKRKSQFNDEVTPFKVPRLAIDVKVVCDSMLLGLGKQLRRCGINVLTATEEFYNDFIDQARRDNRFVITKGKSHFKSLSEEFPPGNAYYMQSDTAIDQLKEVFDYFNVIVDESDSFTVCEQCNSNVFIKVANETMRKLLVTQRGPASKRMIDIALENFKERVPDEMISYTGNRQKNWKLRPESDLTIQNTSRYGPRLFVAGVAVDMNKIPIRLLEYINSFFVCSDCGKCYWESKYLQDLLKKIKTEQDVTAPS